MANHTTKQCETCGADFSVAPYRAEKARFCSTPCTLVHGRAVRWEKHRRDLAERLAAFQVKDGPYECWRWTGFRFRGYGRISVGKLSMGAHRAAYEVERGPIPAGKTVRHTCDNRECTNPAHLILGTVEQNNIDRNKRGRQAKGERQGNARLTEQQVIEMRKSTESNAQIAARLGVAKHTVAAARNGTTWAYLPGAISRKLPWQIKREHGQ